MSVPTPTKAKTLTVRRHGSNTRRLTGASAIYDCVEVRFALGATAAALEVGSLLDRKRHVVDVAVDLRRGLKGNGFSAYDARDSAANDHLLTRDHAGHPALLAHDNLGGLNVTLDLTIDLQNTTADDLQSLSNDFEVVPDDRFFAA